MTVSKFLTKIIGNLFIGLFMPFLLKLRWLPNLYDAIFFKKYVYYDFNINTLSEFLYYLYGESYLIEYIFSVILFLIPFQLIKDFFYKKNSRLSLIKKTIILNLVFIICIIIIGMFSNIWFIPWWCNLIYIIYSFFMSIIITVSSYFIIDKHTEKNNF